MNSIEVVIYFGVHEILAKICSPRTPWPAMILLEACFNLLQVLECSNTSSYYSIYCGKIVFYCDFMKYVVPGTRSPQLYHRHPIYDFYGLYETEGRFNMIS